MSDVGPPDCHGGLAAGPDVRPGASTNGGRTIGACRMGTSRWPRKSGRVDHGLRVLKALNNAYPEWMLLSDLHSAAGYKPAQFAGLMGAFGRRMSHTDGYDRDAHFFEYRWNNDEDAWEYRLPESVREVLNPLQRSDMKALSPSKLKNHALTPGPTQYLAFDELARRIRENPSSWNPGTGLVLGSSRLYTGAQCRRSGVGVPRMVSAIERWAELRA